MKNLKIFLSVALVAVMLGSLLTCFAADESKAVSVNVYDGKNVVVTMEKVAYKDEDSDGKWTINDVLISIHNSKCKDGFVTENGDYGLFIKKLWNIENGGSYGYMLNNNMAYSLTDEVKDGDVVYAYVYADAAGYSDAYSFFDVNSFADKGGEEVTLTLKYVSGYDAETYAPIFVALEGATVTVDGKATEVKTDANGTAKITLPKKSAVISAAKDGVLIIPPVCVSTVSGGANLLWLWIVLAVIAVAVICFVIFKLSGKKNNK
ncbi:MAG: hypothetical protein J5585_00425 [Clostridia bacterium]|nr:hypothetical protein [Clostridia bacterium]